VHRQCTDRLERDNLWAGIHKATQAIARDNPEAEIDDDSTVVLLRPEQRKKIQGQHLKPKLHVLEEMGDLTSIEKQFIAIAHKYRNELYHVGSDTTRSSGPSPDDTTFYAATCSSDWVNCHSSSIPIPQRTNTPASHDDTSRRVTARSTSPL